MLHQPHRRFVQKGAIANTQLHHHKKLLKTVAYFYRNFVLRSAQKSY